MGRLDFLKPFEGTNDVTFTLTPQDAQTRVVWSMDGENDFVGKAIATFSIQYLSTRSLFSLRMYGSGCVNSSSNRSVAAGSEKSFANVIHGIFVRVL